jgi:hypothetical protein
MPIPEAEADSADGVRRGDAGATHGEGTMRPEPDAPTLA